METTYGSLNGAEERIFARARFLLEPELLLGHGPGLLLASSGLSFPVWVWDSAGGSSCARAMDVGMSMRKIEFSAFLYRIADGVDILLALYYHCWWSLVYGAGRSIVVGVGWDGDGRCPSLLVPVGGKNISLPTSTAEIHAPIQTLKHTYYD